MCCRVSGIFSFKIMSEKEIDDKTQLICNGRDYILHRYNAIRANM